MPVRNRGTPFRRNGAQDFAHSRPITVTGQADLSLKALQIAVPHFGRFGLEVWAPLVRSQQLWDPVAIEGPLKA